ncbi:MAG TPA: phosphoglucosamine mutase [Fibrobacteraceae bacterium]|nr:phosphoglucosamine mutase [Fibrobacteraceae bacterium]
MSVLMRSISGIRGIVGDSLTVDTLVSHVRAFLQVTRARRIVLGRDSRPTGSAICEVVSGVCRMAGVSVTDLGLATTPTVELMVAQCHADGGIIITASHNPIEWNALKFLNNKGMFLGPMEVKELFALADQGGFSWPNWEQMGSLEKRADGDQLHIDALLRLSVVDVQAISKAHFKVAVDAVNGAGSKVVPALLRQLGCEVVELHCEPNGLFPRGAEPLPENLKILGDAVRQQGCAVGFALDPDADRCALVDSHGRAVGEEYTLAIASDTVLDRLNGPIAINLSSSRMNEDVAERHGQQCFRASVGEINVSLEMIAKGCVMGGEGNGGTILPALHYGRDSLVACALILDWMARSGKRVEDWVVEHPAYAMPKKKFRLGAKSVTEVLAQVASHFPDWRQDTRDGLWLGKGKTWLHVRASNTEPVIRVIAEAPTASEAEGLCAQVEAFL